MQAHSLKRVHFIFAGALLMLLAIFPLVSRSQSLTTLGMPLAQDSACSANGQHLIPWLGDRWYLSGVNVPWHNGGYGADFGTVEEWGQHTYSSAATEQMFADLNAHGVNSVRWWVFADGRGAPEFDAASGGHVTGFDANTLPSMVDAIKLAARYDIYIVFNLWSVDMLYEDGNAGSKGEHAGGHRDLIVESGKRQSFIQNALLPMLAYPVDGSGYTIGTHPNVLGWDIINEPEWAITEAVGGQGNVSLAQMHRFVAEIAGAIHRNSPQLVTVGSASIKWNSDTAPGADGNWWNDADLTPYDADGYLDFYQVHYYPWMDGDGVSWSYSPLTVSLASGGFDKPTVIGELPGLSSVINPLLDGIHANCYAGAWMWSYEAVDSSGNWPESRDAYARFNSQHADEVAIRPSDQQPDPTSTAVATPTPSEEPTDDPTNDPPAASRSVYTDALASGWADWSWNTTVNLNNASPRHSGSSAIAATYTAPWAGLYLHTSTPISTAEYDTLRFWVHGGNTGGQQLRVWLRDASGNAGSSIDVTAVARTWTQVDLPLSDLGNLANISDIFWQDSTGNRQPTFYIDDVSLLSQATAQEPTHTPQPEPTHTPQPEPTHTPQPEPTSTATAQPTSTPVDDPAQDSPSAVYTISADNLASGWANWSWNTTVNFQRATPRHSGSSSIAVTYTASWAGLYLHTDTAVSTAEYDTLRFWVHGGNTGGQQFRVWLRDTSGNVGPSIDVTAVARTWTQVDLPLSDLGNLSRINDIVWQDTTGNTQPTFYLDDIALVSRSSTSNPPADDGDDSQPPDGQTDPTATATPTGTAVADPTSTATATASPVATATAVPDQPADGDPDLSAQAFLETFDGDPAAPLSWREVDAFNTWDVAVHSRDVSTWQTLEAMEAGHGPNCEPPLATHTVSAYEDAVFQCKNHMMTAINASGYGVIYLTPNHLLDFSTGEAVIRFDISTLATSQRDWWDIWITPYEDNLQLPLQDFYPDLNGPPRRAVQIKMSGNALQALIYDNFSIAQQSQFHGTIPTQWWVGYESFLVPDARRRDTFEIRLSQDHLKVGMPDYNFWWIDSSIDPLDWDQGVVQFGHHSYTPTKDCTDCGPNTWHWDNIALDPAIPFTIIHSDKRRVSGSPELTGEPVLTFDRPAPANAHLRFSGTGNNLQVSFDDGTTWQDVRHQAHGQTPGNFATFWMPIPEGVSRVQFRGERWWGGDWTARDVTIWAPPGTTSR